MGLLQHIFVDLRDVELEERVHSFLEHSQPLLSEIP